MRGISRYLLVLAFFVNACKSGPFSVLRPSSPHELYKAKLISSGLGESALGKNWIDLSSRVLASPVAIELPYLEKGYFPSERVQAAAFLFRLQKGQKLSVKLSKKPAEGFALYTDVWEKKDSGELKIMGSSDSSGTAFQSDIDRTGTYVLRLQPELLAGGEYTLELSSGPSLAFPLKSYQNNQIRSFWGDGRDDNARKHEGVDIFSSFRAPVLAAAAGTATVNENRLGGKVVWLRPEGKDFTLYYAHLDEQVASDGQRVSIGDTIGRMGNTGNARSTPPHLHFGVYSREGAVDPLPFIDPRTEAAPRIRVDTSLLNSSLRTIGNALLNTGEPLKNGTIVHARAASASKYKVELPDGRLGFIPSAKLTAAAKNVQRFTVSSGQLPLFDRPDPSAAVKLYLKAGETVNILGNFQDFNLVSFDDETGWTKR